MSSPRTLADQLRSWPDDQLAQLISARPDVAVPPPQDSAQLASRVGTRASVLRALDGLNRLELVVLDAILVCGSETSVDVVRKRVNAPTEAVDDALARLRMLALVWGADDALRAVGVLGDVFGTATSGLGSPVTTLLAGYGPIRVAALATELGIAPSGDRSADVAAIAQHLADEDHVATLVAEVDERARQILDHLDQEGKDGSVESTERTVSRRDTAAGPVDQLLARGLLVARDRRHVAVPREVGLALRGGCTTRGPVGPAPALTIGERGQDLVDRAAAGAAFELVRHVQLALEHWGVDPPGALRSGGLGVRDLRATAELLHMDERGAALHIELAAAAGLLARDATEEAGAAWLPTPAFDSWLSASMADRWTSLATAWLNNRRLTGVVARRQGTDQPVNALAPGVEHHWLPELRRTALQELATIPDGRVLATGTGVPSLVARMRWLRPRRPSIRDAAVAWTIEEAAVVGVVALGGLATHGRALLAEDGASHRAPLALDPLLPRPVDHMLLQADLTAVAPGPLEQDLAQSLAAVADVESRGGATVYRFTERSVRRALDSGWSAVEIHDFLNASSRTPVPQPLVYLVDDVARTFGAVRVGTAEAFVRSDDEAALTQLVHDPRASGLRLRRIAPTVLVSDTPVEELLARLRELGSAPVVEAADGTVMLARRQVHRARSSRSHPDLDPAAGPAPGDHQGAARFAARVVSAVTAIRAGDRTATHRTRRPAGSERQSTAEVLAVLREAADAGETVSIGYLDKHGAAGDRLVDPVHVHAGELTAYDHRSGEVRLFAVHRISGVYRDRREGEDSAAD